MVTITMHGCAMLLLQNVCQFFNIMMFTCTASCCTYHGSNNLACTAVQMHIHMDTFTPAWRTEIQSTNIATYQGSSTTTKPTQLTATGKSMFAYVIQNKQVNLTSNLVVVLWLQCVVYRVGCYR